MTDNRLAMRFFSWQSRLLFGSGQVVMIRHTFVGGFCSHKLLNRDTLGRKQNRAAKTAMKPSMATILSSLRGRRHIFQSW